VSLIVDEIVASRTWRLRELEQLKKVYIIDIKNKKISFSEQYLRMCIPYVYAHWEGFIVESFKLLIDYLNNLTLKNTETANQLLTFSHLKTLRPLSGKQSFDSCEAFVENFSLSLKTEKLFIDRSNFSTKSNLNYSQLQEIFSWFNWNKDCCSEYKLGINKLVNQRNQIAHGENGIVIGYKTVADYVIMLQEIYDLVIVNFDEYINKFMYLKPLE